MMLKERYSGFYRALLVVIVILILVVIFLLCVGSFHTIKLKQKENYTTWEEYVETYEDKELDISFQNDVYENKLMLKDKSLYVICKDCKSQETELIDGLSGKIIFSDVMDIYSIKYNDTEYIYVVDFTGKLYYLKRIDEPFELIELGDYKDIVSIKKEKDKIVAKDIKENTYDLSEKIESYIS